MRYLRPDPVPVFTGRAAWCWSGEGVWGVSPDPRPVQVRWFARRIEFPVGGRAVLALSADTRYVLYVNGRLVARGPQKGDVAHQYYDTLDLGDELEPGANLLLVRVDSNAKSFPLYMSTGPSASEMSAATVFAADGVVTDAAGAHVDQLATPNGWLVRLDPALEFHHDDQQASYVGYKETIDFARLPRDFHARPDLADGAWAPATVIFPAFTPATALDAFLPHRLLPRSIPPLRLTPQPLAALREVREGHAVAALVDGALSATVPARTRWVAILDAGRQCTAYPELRWRGGEAARIVVRYAECLYDGERKTDRNRVAGLRFVGYADRITVGNGHRTWSPLHWRSGRYLELTIETAGEPLALERLALLDCHYPIAAAEPFRASDPALERMWEVGIRTQQCCAHDTFEDCPYYEQLQYAGDTQLQALVTMAASGDTALTRQALRFFHWSMLPEGITQSRYPSRPTQVIPFWSLHYLLMLHDWWMWTGDAGAIREETLAATRVLRWFLDRRDASGLVGALPYWCVADWGPEWMDRFGGNVPGVKDGPSALPNLMLIAALDRVGEVLAALGEQAEAERWAGESTRLRPLVHGTFWDEARALYRDIPGQDVVSQLTNAWGLLTGLTPADRRARSAEAMAGTPDICRAAYFGHGYLFEAWSRAGRGDLVVREFASYRGLLDLGVTTWPEDPRHGRSDCHAWSNAATYHLLRTVLGFAVLEPGCRTLAIRPHLDGLGRAAGAFMTPHGPARLAFARGDERPFTATVPDGVRARVVLDGRERELGPGTHRF
jgi:hypothetical protein